MMASSRNWFGDTNMDYSENATHFNEKRENKYYFSYLKQKCVNKPTQLISHMQE